VKNCAAAMDSCPILNPICDLGVALNGWGIRIAALCLPLRNRKRRLNLPEELVSMHLLAPAGELGLKFVTPDVCQNHLSRFGAIWPELCWCAIKTKQANKLNQCVAMFSPMISDYPFQFFECWRLDTASIGVQ
jgi:hypothetical protein